MAIPDFTTTESRLPYKPPSSAYGLQRSSTIGKHTASQFKAEAKQYLLTCLPDLTIIHDL
jgi:hypothetical protein